MRTRHRLYLISALVIAGILLSIRSGAHHPAYGFFILVGGIGAAVLVGRLACYFLVRCPHCDSEGVLFFANGIPVLSKRCPRCGQDVNAGPDALVRPPGHL